MSLYVLSETLQAAVNAGNPQRVLIEFFEKPDDAETPYDPPVQFSNEDILITNGLQLTSEFNSETDLKVGLCPSAEIRFSMLNDFGQLANFEFGRFRAYLGARIAATGTNSDEPEKKQFSDGYYEFAPLGTFIAHRPDIVRKKTIDVDANDQMTLFDKEIPSGMVINYPIRLEFLAEALCDMVGVEMKDSQFMNADIVVQKRPDKFDGATMRDIIGWIAEAACSIARFDRNGKLEFAWFSQVNRTFDEHSYAEFTPSWYETQTIDSLHIRNADETGEISMKYDETTGEIIDGAGNNEYMIQDNPFLRQPEPDP